MDDCGASGPTTVHPVAAQASPYDESVDLELLDRTLAAAGEPAFRARQAWEWAARGATGYDEMTNLPAGLRQRLADEVPFSSLTVAEQAESTDGTVKTLFHTADGRPVEAVLMRYRDGRRSLCLSSQSGCPLTCTFCATGTMRFGRNLTASEILDQALHFRRIEPVDHAVFMGMGEPMMNLEGVLAASRRLPDIGITHRRTTVSTVGWIPGIDRLATTDMPLRLAFSLHAPDDALRSQIMPVNERYPLADVLAACRRWHAAKRRPVFIEYVMLAGVNDRPDQSVALARLLDPKVFKVNLIPYNPSGSPYDGSSPEAIERFRATLEAQGRRVTVRLTRGRDIAAACGQLAAAAA
jgi:23S rRNA (adenine2503-C2)-methyltransferase